MNYIDILKNIPNYAVTISYQKKVNEAGTLWGDNGIVVGIIDDDSTSWDFSTEFTTKGGLSGSGPTTMKIAEGALNFIGKFVAGSSAGNLGTGIKDMAENITGQSLEDTQLSTTICKPSGYGGLDLSFSCTFFTGMELKGPDNSSYKVPKYSSFMKMLAGFSLPYINSKGGGLIDTFTSVTASLLNPQISDKTLGLIGAAKTIGGQSQDSDWIAEIKKELFNIRIGKHFFGDGYWLESAKVSAVNKYDKNGTPLIWTVSFAFKRFAQPTVKDAQNMFV